jgi:hypothetical protein
MARIRAWRDLEFESSRVSCHSGFQGFNKLPPSPATHRPSHAPDIKPDNGHGPAFLTWHDMSSCHSQLMSNFGVKLL